jgi:hypothetical protein
MRLLATHPRALRWRFLSNIAAIVPSFVVFANGLYILVGSMILPRFCSSLRGIDISRTARSNIQPPGARAASCRQRNKKLPSKGTKENFFVRVFFNGESDGEKLIPIVKIKAASSWYGERVAASDAPYKERALENLINAAEDVDADAIIGVEYAVDHVDAGDTPGSAPLQRIFATGVAVKFPRS